MSRTGRDAVNILMAEMETNVEDFGRAEATELLVSFGFKPKKIVRPLNDWMRQAQLDLARGMTPTTSRFGVKGHQTTTGTKAVADKREDSMVSRTKDTHTRLVNDNIMQTAHAKQPDATATEKALATLSLGMSIQHQALVEIVEIAAADRALP